MNGEQLEFPFVGVSGPVALPRAGVMESGGAAAGAPLVAAVPRLALVPKRRGGGRIPMNVAFREITAFVAAELAAAGEQWSDAARQDAVSTVFITASKAGWIGAWERDPAA